MAELRALAADPLRTAELFERLTGGQGTVRADRGQVTGHDGYERLNP